MIRPHFKIITKNKPEQCIQGVQIFYVNEEGMNTDITKAMSVVRIEYAAGEIPIATLKSPLPVIERESE